MPVTLDTQTRSIDLSGLSGSPAELDPLLYCRLEGTTPADITYGTLDGETGITVASGSHFALLAATGMVWNIYDADYPADEARIDIVLDHTENCNVALYHMAHSTTDAAQTTYTGEAQGKQIRFQVGPTVTRFFSKASDTGGFTQIGTDVGHGLTAGYARFRCSATRPNATSTDLTIEHWSGSSWDVLQTRNVLDSAGTVPEVASWVLESAGGSNNDLRCHSISVTRKAVRNFFPCYGQSEMAGDDATPLDETTAGVWVKHRDFDIAQMNESTASKGWCGGVVPTPYNTDLIGNTTTDGSIEYRTAKRITSIGEQLWYGGATRGGSALDDFDPPADSNRYNCSIRSGVAHLVTMLYAGDGKNGTDVRWLFWQGTRDTRIQTTEAAYNSDLDAIAQRIAALHPTAKFYVALTGDRTSYALDPGPGNVSEADWEAIRDAQLDTINTEANAYRWFDDDARRDATGWLATEGGGHPGTDDYHALAALAAAAIVGGGVLQRLNDGSAMPSAVRSSF